jgi:hypothetical protein
MIDNYKVVTCTPYGRKKYFEILSKYLLHCRNIIDRHQIWINTNNEDDIEYAKSLEAQYPDFFEIIYCPIENLGEYRNETIHLFFEYCKDPNTVYVRFDDDIVWFDHNELENFIKFRVLAKEYFIIYANIVNNGLCHYIHQRIGSVSLSDSPPVEYKSDNKLWKDGNIGLSILKQFIAHYENNAHQIYMFGLWQLLDLEICSINVISWLGSEFAKIDKFHPFEENWFSNYKPQERNTINCIYGGFLAVHYAFHTQRNIIDSHPEVLESFKKFSLELDNG